MTHQSASDTPDASVERTRRARSKNGCLTCRRRRVACNQQKPRCNHCERLSLHRSWRDAAASVSSEETYVSRSPGVVTAVSLESTSAGHLSDVWDFNELIWQDTSTLNTIPTEWAPGQIPVSTTTYHALEQSLSPSLARALPISLSSPASSTEGGQVLVEHFLDSIAPPILAPVEFGPRWTSTKLLFASLAASSDMVRYAIMAFSALQIGETDHRKHKTHYDKAIKCLSSFMVTIQTASADSLDLQYPLAATFFLAYSALLTNRVSEAQSVLKDATTLIRIHPTKVFSLAEKRLISWIRLVDARASSAGGDGAFLNETDSENYSPDAHPKESLHMSLNDTNMDTEIEEVLFDVLHTPGLIFYQRVQSIMARVSNIDPWHRSRGTVADETEVMSIAAEIRKDLLLLETQRPALTDHAIAGRLSQRHLGENIANAITHSYRLYWANYEAAFIHIHRVAHKHLPPTDQVLRARATIKNIAQLFCQAETPLPVNFIWPLLMACCEEDNADDRAWMIAAIRSMQSTASNAKPIADVLEEVHRRQDATGQRADVRQTSMDMFNMSFAVV